MEGQDGRLLAAVLGRRRGEDAADLADELALRPERAGWSRKVFICEAMLP